MAAPQFFRLVDFSGGLNLDQHPVLLKDNEAVDILNFSLTRRGSLISRRGYTRLIPNSLDSDVVQLGRYVEPAQGIARLLIHLADGTIRVLDGTNLETVATGFGNAKGGFISAQDHTIYANGETRPILYDGTEAMPLGIDAPASLTATAQAGGSLDEGTYLYAVSFYASGIGVESNTFAAQPVAVSGSNLTVQLTLPASPDDRVDRIRIYRTRADATVLQYLDEVDATSGTYMDDGTNALNPFIPAPSGQYEPAPNFENVAYLNGWYFGGIGRTLYWSLPYDPHHWPPLNSTEVPFLGNDEIVALVAHQDTLLIFGHQNLLVVTGQGPNWSITRLDTEVGISSRDATTEFAGEVVFLAHDGLRVFPGLQPYAPALDRTLSSIPQNLRKTAVLGHVDEDRELWVTVGGQTFAILQPEQTITRYDLAPVAILHGGVTGEDSPIMAVEGGKVLAEYGGTTDDGKPIKLLWSSKTFQLPNPEKTKYLRRLGGYATIGSVVDAQLHPMTGNPYTVRMESSGSTHQALWDMFLWGDLWTTEGLDYRVAALPAHTLQGNTFRLVLTASAEERTEIAPPLTLLYRESNRLLGE